MNEVALALKLLWIVYGDVISLLGQIMTITMIAWSFLHLVGRIGKNPE
jgi:hypothetical protein